MLPTMFLFSIWKGNCLFSSSLFLMTTLCLQKKVYLFLVFFFVVQFFFLVSGVLLTHYHYSNTDMTRLQKERREGGSKVWGRGDRWTKRAAGLSFARCTMSSGGIAPWNFESWLFSRLQDVVHRYSFVHASVFPSPPLRKFG